MGPGLDDTIVTEYQELGRRTLAEVYLLLEAYALEHPEHYIPMPPVTVDAIDAVWSYVLAMLYLMYLAQLQTLDAIPGPPPTP